MEECYEYLGCDKEDCVMHGLKGKKCWEVEGTLCNHLGIKLIRDKYTKTEESCARSGCIYYKYCKSMKR